MKRNVLHDIMSLAWQFVKRNGFTMSEALKVAWANMKLKAAMKQRIVKFYFQKVGGKRKGILVFTRFLKEAQRLTQSIPGTAIVSGDTPKKERERILEEFKAGEIPVVANVGVLTTGFDYPELDTIVMARPTMSLALWYQIVGRAIRPHPTKEAGWIVDLCGNIKRFGEVKDLRLVNGGNGKWAVFSNNRQLTNVRF